ncbi:MAG: ATP-binding cassette domain-containing protein [Acidimicrobiales bacterium]
MGPTRVGPSLLGGGAHDRREQARALEVLAMMGLHSFRNAAVGTLSTGTRRITELACVIALEPVVLLLDEPSSGTAQRESEALGELLAREKRELDLSMVVIERDIPLVMSIADRVVAMEAGSVIADGTPEQVKADP